MLAERTTLSMLPTITWEQGTSCRQSTVPSMPGNCSARRSRSASFVRQRLNCSAGAAISDAVGWRPLHAGYAARCLSYSHTLHRCVRRPTTGVDAFARMGQAGSKRERSLPESVVPAQRWRVELPGHLFLVCASACRWMISLELLGVFG